MELKLVIGVVMFYKTDDLTTKQIHNRHRIQRPGGGDKKHEIYVAAFGGHLFYDLFVQGWGQAMAPRHPPGSATDNSSLLYNLISS